MSRYLLSPSAREDLLYIQKYYLQQAGPEIAKRMLTEFRDAFRLLSQNPGLGHSRTDLAEDRPLLFWPLREYLVVYKGSSIPIEIHSIFHGRRDVPRLLENRS
jgi:plasmid stabilization system protein ParE